MIQVSQITVGPVFGRVLSIYPFAADSNFSVTSSVNNIATLRANSPEVLRNIFQGGGSVNNQGTFNDVITYGGIAPDNSATAGPQVIYGSYPETTQVPPQQLPVSGYVYDDYYNGIFELLNVIDNSTIQIADPMGYAANKPNGWSFVYGLSRTICPMKEVQLVNANDYNLYMLGMDYVTIPAGANLILQPDKTGEVKPFMIDGLGNPVTVIITY